VTIDLSQLPWDGQTFEIDAELGAGEFQVLIPQTVGIDFNGEVGVGAIGGSLATFGGIGVDERFRTDGDNGTLIADLELGMGTINIWYSYDETSQGIYESGDLYVVADDESDLASAYTTEGGDIELNLSGLELTRDRFVAVQASGDISIVIPADISYRIRAFSEVGTIDVLGEGVREGGGAWVRVDSVESLEPVLQLEITSGEGNITVLSEGDRS
jgi:hypothetical protein